MYRWRTRGLGSLGLGDLTSSISAAIAQFEGFNSPGSLAARNNNPGNLRSGPGQIGTSGGFAVFPDASTGWAALNNQVNLNISRGLTMDQFFGGGNGYPGYAPSADSNNPAAYSSFVANAAGVPTNVPLNEVGSTPVVTGNAGGTDPIFSTDSTGSLSTPALVGLGLAAAGLVMLAVSG